MNVWIKLIIVSICILVNNYFVYISTKARAKAEFGEQFTNGMMEEMKKINHHECTTNMACMIDLAKINTWEKAFNIVKDICELSR